jgi:hypothetical protein
MEIFYLEARLLGRVVSDRFVHSKSNTAASFIFVLSIHVAIKLEMPLPNAKLLIVGHLISVSVSENIT